MKLRAGLLLRPSVQFTAFHSKIPALTMLNSLSY